MALALLAACDAGETRDKIGVVTTISPLSEFTKAVGGDKVDVSTLVPPGSSPHTYEPTPTQLVKLSDASMYVKSGSGIEFEIIWMDRIRAVSGEMLIIDVSSGIQLLAMEDHELVVAEEPYRAGEDKKGRYLHGESKRGTDPHTWLSPVNAREMVTTICLGLIELDPSHETYYTRNMNEFHARLDTLDRYIREKLDGVSGTHFLTYHPAWSYFADEYGLEQMAIEHGGKEPTAREMVSIVTKAKNLGISAILVDPRSTTVSAETIAREIDGRIVFADPVADDYIESLRNLTDELVEILR